MKSRKIDSVAKWIIVSIAMVTILSVFFIFLFVFIEAKDVLFDQETRNKTFGTIFSTNWQPVSNNPKYGVIPLFIGTIKTTIVAIVIAAPLGIFAAIYSSCFAPKKLRAILKPTVELLSGIPSVVIGFFALVVIATVVQDVTGSVFRLNALTGGIAIAITAIPIIFTISEESMSSISSSLIEASYALGASRWETVYRVILPAAQSGILASILLGMGRAIGETLIVLMATGNAAITSISVLDSTRTLTATIGAEMAEAVFGDTHYSVLFFIGGLLFIFTFFVNMLVFFFLKRRAYN